MKQTCARCGHTTPECDKCGQSTPLLGSSIRGHGYCHTFSEQPSCYTLELRQAQENRLSHNLSEDQVQNFLDFVEYALDGRASKAVQVASGLSLGEASKWWSILDGLTDVIAAEIGPNGPQ